jgi:hypothetical protein
LFTRLMLTFWLRLLSPPCAFVWPSKLSDVRFCVAVAAAQARRSRRMPLLPLPPALTRWLRRCCAHSGGGRKYGKLG